MRILFLYSEYVNYQDGLIRCLSVDHGAVVKVVSWDKNLLKPVDIPDIPGVDFYKRSDLNDVGLVDLIENFDPTIVYISGWMDDGYLRAINSVCNRKNFITVCGFDDNWFGTIRQLAGSLYFKIFMRRYFDVAWVAGARQYHYARKMGYDDHSIIFNLLSCNTDLFRNNIIRHHKTEPRLRRFFYVGNFRAVKGVDLLADAYCIYRDKLAGQCQLVCIGQGELRSRLLNESGIQVIPYLSSSELILATESYDVFVFPSIRDQWGVALHEFGLLGFPLLSSKGAGAVDSFLIDGYNGFLFEPGDSLSLASKLKQFELLSADDLGIFGVRSKLLAERITSEISAASLVSLCLRRSVKV